MEALVPLGDKGRVRAELLDVFLDLVVKTGEQSRDQHDDADTEHDAKHGEGTAHFMSAQGVHGLFQVFAVCLSHGSPSRPRGALRWDRAWRHTSRDRSRRKVPHRWKRPAK